MRRSTQKLDRRIGHPGIATEAITRLPHRSQIKHRSERALPYPAGPLFNIAADVARYPEFLPGWLAVRVMPCTPEDYHTEQLLAFGPLRERFRSHTHLEPPHRIDVFSKGRTFRHLRVGWRFLELAQDRTHVQIDMELELHTRALGFLVEPLISGKAEAIADAFERRVAELARSRRLVP